MTNRHRKMTWSVLLPCMLGWTGTAEAQIGREMLGEWRVEEIRWHAEKHYEVDQPTWVTIDRDQIAIGNDDQFVTYEFEFVECDRELLKFDIVGVTGTSGGLGRCRSIAVVEASVMTAVIPWFTPASPRPEEFTTEPEPPYILFRLARHDND